MAIQLTENAARQIQKQLAQRGRGIGLRVGVKDVGCSGFGYTYSYSYSCLTHTDVHAGQSIHDKPDWRQHCARHDRHR